MKTPLGTLPALFAFLVLAQPGRSAPPAAAEMIRETKSKVMQHELETALAEKLQMEKQLLLCPESGRALLKERVAALAGFCDRLERDLQQLGSPKPDVRPSPEALRKSARESIAALLQWRAAKNGSTRAAIAKLRDTAAGELKQQAASADPAASTALLAEARRLGTVEPEVALDAVAQPGPVLKGVWEHGLSPYRKSCFASNGCAILLDGTPHGTWAWLDEAQGLFFVDDSPSKWMNLCRIVDGETIESVVVDGAQFKYKRKSAEPVALPSLPPGCTVLTRLVAAEKELRDQADAAWQQETGKVVEVLKGVGHELPEQERAGMAQAGTALLGEKSCQLKTEPTDRLAGKWILEGRIFQFAAGGVVMVNGEPHGKWLWGKSRSRDHVVFTLGAGQMAALGNLSGAGDAMELFLPGAEVKHAMKQ